VATPAPRGRAARPRKAPPAPVPTGADTDNGSRPQQPILTRSEAVLALTARANSGSKDALAALRRLLDQCPEVWTHVGDLARHAEAAWLDLISAGDRLVAESAKRRVALLKSQLAGPTPSPLESLLVDQVACTWLAAQYSEAASAKPGSTSPNEATYRLKRAETAQKRHLAAVRTLAALRALVPRGLVPACLSRPAADHRGQGEQQ
jgi:hypothetical protein